MQSCARRRLIDWVEICCYDKLVVLGWTYVETPISTPSGELGTPPESARVRGGRVCTASTLPRTNPAPGARSLVHLKRSGPSRSSRQASRPISPRDTSRTGRPAPHSAVLFVAIRRTTNHDWSASAPRNGLPADSCWRMHESRPVLNRPELANVEMPECSRRYGRKSGRALRELHMLGPDTRFAGLVSYYASRAAASRSLIRRVRAQSLDWRDGLIPQHRQRREIGLAIADRCRLHKNTQGVRLARLRIVVSYRCFLQRARTALRAIADHLAAESALAAL